MQIVTQSAGPFSDDCAKRLAHALGANDSTRRSSSCVVYTLGRTPLARDALHAVCGEHDVDSAIVQTLRPLSDFGLLVFDMDSTLINIECIDELADLVGKKQEVAALTEQAMRCGNVDYDTSLRMRTRLLAGLSVARFDDVYAQRLQITPGAAALIKTAKLAGLKTAIVSGGFDYFTGRVRAELGVDEDYSNRLEVVAGKLTGELLGTLINADVKAQRVQALCRDSGISTGEAIVVGDGANDLKMMALAGLSVGYCAKPVVRAAVDVNIERLGLDSLLTALDAQAAPGISGVDPR